MSQGETRPERDFGLRVLAGQLQVHWRDRAHAYTLLSWVPGSGGSGGFSEQEAMRQVLAHLGSSPSVPLVLHDVSRVAKLCSIAASHAPVTFAGDSKACMCALMAVFASTRPS